MKPRKSSTTLYVGLFVLILTAVPKLNVRVGPVPVYLIDFLVIFLCYIALQRSKFEHHSRPFWIAILILYCFTIIGELVGFIYTGALFEHAYLILRMTISFLTFFWVGQLIRTMDDVEMVLKAAVVGLITTALTMVLSSIPITRPFIAHFVLDNPMLDPAGERIAEIYLSFRETGQRGRSLIGVPTISGSWINITWPLAALLYRWPGEIGAWRKIALFACIVAPLGVLMGYSRGPIVGMLLLIMASVFLGLRHIRRGILIPLVFGAFGILTVGINSEVFFFDRLVKRSTAAIENPLNNEQESERILSYIEPFGHVIENPQFLFAGQGTAIMRSTTVRPEIAGKANHSLFGIAYYSNGMIAAFVYQFLIINALFYAFWHVRRRQTTFGGLYSQALFASILVIVPWSLFTHAIVSAPRGTMMFFFVVGLLTTLRHFPIEKRP